MIRIIVAGLVVAGLALGIWLLWPSGDPASGTATTVAAAPETTSTALVDPTTTSTSLTTTSTIAESHVVETVEEAEEILRELWFGWFEGIYNQDEDRIREVVATEEQLNEGILLFETMTFTKPPTSAEVSIQSVEILRTDDQCLVVWVTADASAFRGEGAAGTAVYVLRIPAESWAFASSWANRGDLWEADCDAVLQPLP